MPVMPYVPEIITTERLTIRPPRVEDVPEIFGAVRESLAELRPWMPWAVESYGIEECEANTREAIAAFITRRDLRYHAHDKETGRHVVSSGLHRIDWSVPRFEIGYWCRTAMAGRGYVSETVRALTQMAFEQLGAARLEIRCDDRNLRSAQVAESCGYVLEGVLKNHGRGLDGSLRSTRVYARTKP